jgi:nucleoside-diphosphate-sugar epimerase
MKILLTGATGFIGSHCLSLLAEEKHEIHAVSSRKIENVYEGQNVNWHHLNLFDLDKIKFLISDIKPTHLLHLSWYVVPGSSASSIENYYWIQASLELLLRFYENGGKRIVMAGSSFEYDWNYGFCSENITPKRPSTFYGICKNALHEVLSGYSERTELSSAWARIFFLYGPNEHPDRLVPSVIVSLLRGQPALCSHGNQIRDYLYVKDVADAIINLLKSNVVGPINIGSGIPIYLKDIILRIGEKIGKKELIRLGAIPSRPNDTRIVIADTERLNNELGWTPRYDLDRGLDETIESISSKMNL